MKCAVCYDNKVLKAFVPSSITPSQINLFNDFYAFLFLIFVESNGVIDDIFKDCGGVRFKVARALGLLFRLAAALIHFTVHEDKAENERKNFEILHHRETSEQYSFVSPQHVLFYVEWLML